MMASPRKSARGALGVLEHSERITFWEVYISRVGQCLFNNQRSGTGGQDEESDERRATGGCGRMSDERMRANERREDADV